MKIARQCDPFLLYKDWEEIGSGCQGDVYRATEITTDRLVAIKKVRLFIFLIFSD